MLKQAGPSRNVVNYEWGNLMALNKKFIDPQAARFTALAAEGIVKAIVNGPDVDDKEGVWEEMKPKHAKYTELGNKKVLYGKEILIEQADAVSFEQDEEITLMNWGNAFIRRIEKADSADPNKVTGLSIELHLKGDVKKTKKKITWLAATEGNQVSVDLVTFDHLITKDKLEQVCKFPNSPMHLIQKLTSNASKDDVLENFLTPKTEDRVRCVADLNVKDLQAGEILQFDRKGYEISAYHWYSIY